MSRVFVDERDTFLAYSLIQAADGPHFQDGVHNNEPKVVVGVVGIGHVAGIVKKWDKVEPTDVTKTLQIPQPSVMSRCIKTSLRLAFWGVAAYGAYRYVLRRPIQRFMALR